ncbi:hypothetical protein ATCC90586_008162 [Pythium insidiosum]|nr:hypothetical protein ATCC90586_008162 [Pythium insidiosum]
MPGVTPITAAAVARSPEEAFIPDHIVGRRLVVSTNQFRAIWLAFVAIALANSLLATTFAAVYYGGLAIRNGVLIESAGLIDIRYIPFIIAVYLVTAAVFWGVVLRVLRASVVHRRLTLRVNHDDVRSSSSSMSCGRGILSSLSRWWSHLYGTFRLELSQEAFEALFLARELVEIASQSYQAYNASRLITVPIINDFYVGVITLNCWCTPLIHWLTRRDAALQRFWYLWADILLDFVSAITIPVVLVVFRDSTSHVGGDVEYAFEAPYEDVVLIHQIRSVQQVFVVSWVDFVAKMLPFMSMLACLLHIQGLVRREEELGITGHADEIDHAISLVEPGGVGFLVITHCTDLHVPPRIRSLRNILGVELMNVTLAAWNDDASLDNAHHPYIQFATLALSNMTELPRSMDMGVPRSINLDKQMDEVTELVKATNLFTPETIAKEVDWFYGPLGLHDFYFSGQPASVIAAHIQSVLAAKLMSKASGKAMDVKLEQEAWTDRGRGS